MFDANDFTEICMDSFHDWIIFKKNSRDYDAPLWVEFS